MTLEEYEELRANPTHFAVVCRRPHVFPEAERVIVKVERYWVVEKVARRLRLPKSSTSVKTPPAASAPPRLTGWLRRAQVFGPACVYTGRGRRSGGGWRAQPVEANRRAAGPAPA